MHQFSWNRPAPISDPFLPQWTNELTERALENFSQDSARPLRALLEPLHKRSHELFIPQCWISGDTNRGNWSLRDDGTLVLFDWERFGLGTPAIDVAITIPGLGHMEHFRKTALTYDANCGFDFIELVAVAKAWSIVEFLSMHSEGRVSVRGESAIQELRNDFPIWLRSIFAALRHH